MALHEHQHRVTTRHQQDDQRQLQVGLLEERRVQVGFEVIDRHEWHTPHQGQGLGSADPDEQGPHEARTGGSGHGIHAIRAGRVVDPSGG